ncbi:MAG: methyltransferase domain-containing protein, partial [Pseudomonadota bacterium]
MGAQLFDSQALAARRARVGRAGGGADFLHTHVARAMADRLAEVTRAFQAPALLGWTAADRVTGVAAEPQTLGADETLPLGEARHDLVLSSLLMHSLNDPVGHLIQLRRALSPDGLALVALFGGQTLTELRASL